MNYRIKEKFWSFGDRFHIADENGTPCFTVVGKAFSWGDKLSFQDTHGHELAFIAQTLLSWKPRYRIEIGGAVFAEMIKDFSWFRKSFTLDVPGPNDYVIQGAFWSHEFTFLRKGRNVATVSKKRWSWTDSYGVQIEAGEDEVTILCACIVIDQVLDDETKRRGAGGGSVAVS